MSARRPGEPYAIAQAGGTLKRFPRRSRKENQ